MQLHPRYRDPPIISVEVRAPGPHPVVGQRQRLAATLSDLSEDEWVRPSRCAGWSVQDVVTHLASTNSFWAFSIQAGLAGTPTRFLASFDPVASPAQLVDEGIGTSPETTLAQFLDSNTALIAAVDGLGEADWETVAESPPGHVPISLLADHALWDSWVHERDIVLPLGRPATVEPGEVLACLRYGSALGRAFAINEGSTERGTAVLEVTDPAERVVVTVEEDRVRVHAEPTEEAALVLCADAVTLVEMLSLRDVGLATPPGLRWLTAGLAEVFDQPTSG